MKIILVIVTLITNPWKVSVNHLIVTSDEKISNEENKDIALAGGCKRVDIYSDKETCSSSFIYKNFG